jgi:DNA-binding beta-propeller fold protein YncE
MKMNTNRILITIIVVAVVLVGVFTVRALLNSQEVLSPEPSEVPESANTIESQEESIADVTANETSSDSMSSEPEVAAQPDWTSALDLIRIVEISVQPHDFGFDDQGNLFVVSADVSNPQIMKYDQEGNMLESWGSRGSGPGEFEFASPPGGPPMEGGFLVLDETGKVYVSDPYNNRVQTFDSDGNYLGEWTQLGEGGDHFNVPGPLSTDANGNIFVADFDGVHQFKLDGSYVGMLETTGEVAANSKGELYATIAFQNLVAKLDQDGQVQDTWGGEGDSEDGMFDFPMLMVIDKQDNIYVADHSGRLQIFDTEGNFLGRFNMTTLCRRPEDHLCSATPARIRDYRYLPGGFNCCCIGSRWSFFNFPGIVQRAQRSRPETMAVPPKPRVFSITFRTYR